MKREIITAKMPKQRRRADFLFHNGAFRPQSTGNGRAYNRKKLARPLIDKNGDWC